MNMLMIQIPGLSLGGILEGGGDSSTTHVNLIHSTALHYQFSSQHIQSNYFQSKLVSRVNRRENLGSGSGSISQLGVVKQ